MSDEKTEEKKEDTIQWKNKRVKTPTVLQMEAVECGAASLSMVLGYYGRYEPLEKLRTQCGVSRDGSKASNVLKAARQFYGMDARGFRKEPAQLHELRLPMILFWNFNHFVVLEGIKGNKVYINDPGRGPVCIPWEEFDDAFTGVVLTFSPGEGFQPGGKKKSTMASLKNRLQGCRSVLTYIILTALLLVIPGIVIPTFSKIFVDNVLVSQMDGWMKPLLVAMSLTALLRFFLSWLQQSYLLRMEAKLAISNSAAFFQHVLKLPVEFFAQRFAGEIGTRIMLNDKIANLLSGQLATNILNILMIFFFALVMFQYDILLSVVGVLMAGINLLALKYASRVRVDLNQNLQQESGKLMGTAMGGLQMVETLKATGGESDFYAQWAGYYAKVTNADQKLGYTTQILSAVPPFLTALNNIVILGLGGIKIMSGSMSMGMLIAFQTLMSSFMAPVTQLVNLGSQLQDTQADMNKLDDVLKNKVDPRFEIMEKQEQETTAEPLADVSLKLTGRIELKNISFGYSPLEDPLIEDFSLSLNPGSRVALVGGSGSGKSTVAKLVSGLYHPWKGNVLFDGTALLDVPRDILNNSLAMVNQEIFLFDGTIKENLTMWDPTVPEENVMLAARDACIHDVIAARPGGYQSRIGEGGGNFSGGQRQRLEIARGLVINPTIMVLDEATSALDAATEKIVDDNVRRRGCTCIIVAHRLSTIRDCDEIIVLRYGKVVQRGTHDELIEQEGEYADLVKSQ